MLLKWSTENDEVLPMKIACKFVLQKLDLGDFDI